MRRTPRLRSMTPCRSSRRFLTGSARRRADEAGAPALLFRRQHLALADVVGGADHALLLHLFHEPRGLVVADRQLALDVGGRALPVAHRDLHRLVVERVLAAGIAAGPEAQDRVDALGL